MELTRLRVLPIQLEIFEAMDEQQSQQREAAKCVDEFEPIGFGRLKHAEELRYVAEAWLGL